ncbi:MAG: bifunctional methylenetetrahydrofolate dehydrogenase/methenyltetrahydrofolate cyclohydrolase FolD [Clostridia bacterium]
MAMILDGKKLAAQMREEMKSEVQEMKAAGVHPCLAVVLVGEDPASRIYVSMKEKDCEKVGILSMEFKLDASTPEEELLQLVDRLNDDKKVHGILVQLPLPGHIDENTVLNRLKPEKDVDGFHPVNAGRLLTGQDSFVPCTPLGVIELIKMSGIEISGKSCVVVGRSNIVGKPAAILLLKEHGTVTICHSRTRNLKEVTGNADILVAAIGRPDFITGDMVKEGAVVIDVGINRLADNKVTGDVNYEEASRKAAAITPVPGGVGPMTRTMLLKNTIKAAKKTIG